MPLGEIQKHGRAAAASHDPASLRIGGQSMFLQELTTSNEPHSILSIQAILRAAIRTDRLRGAVCALECMSGNLAVPAIANRTDNWRTEDLDGGATARATGETLLHAFIHLLKF